MRLQKLRIKNYRSIVDTEEVRVEALQALVGENNAGKSNLLRAIQCFLTSGAGGTQVSDFTTANQPIVIECEFAGLSEAERKKLRPYLLGDRVLLRKELRVEVDEGKGRTSVKAEYHGYQAEPSAEHLSIAKIEAASNRPRWDQIAEAAGIEDYVRNDEGRINKTSYKAGLERYLAEHEVEYDDPVLGETHALGIPQNLLSALPEYYLLPAITDYSDEIDRRSTSTVFRRLMAELSDRLMRADPRYQELEDALARVRALLNPLEGEGAPARLTALSDVEETLAKVVQRLMPTIQSINLGVEVDASRELFSKGVSIKIDDGVLTDVLEKGHGMQRSLVFSLLQMLIASKRSEEDDASRPIILAIEEPELYIHPHCQRLIFQVLKEFAGLGGDEETGTDQVIYTTHSPAFVEVWNYERIGLVRKPDLQTGTIVRQAETGALGDPEEKKAFKTLTSFSLRHNEVFFARHAVLVEGPEDEVAVIATARKIGCITELPDELGLSIVVTDGKGDIPKFQRVLNAFGLSYGVLLELDGKAEDHPSNAAILGEVNGNRLARIPTKLEEMVGVGRHFDDQRHAKNFFGNPNNITPELMELVAQVLPA